MLTRKIDENGLNIRFVVGNEITIGSQVDLPALGIFDDCVLNFLDEVAHSILNDKASKQFSDVLTFGFWCRKASLLKERKNYSSEQLFLGRGLVFHIAPSNVPIMFAYTLVSGLLAGNANIVRLPSRQFPQTDYLCDIFNQVLQQESFRILRQYISCIYYDRSQVNETTWLSQICDARVIWGGDATISEIRKYPLKPRACEITFSDRHSICVIDSEEWMQCEDKSTVLRGFYNDTYLTDQNSCSSPKFILWLGEQVDEARGDFWYALEEIVAERYDFQDIQSVIKLESCYRMVEQFPDLKLYSNTNYIVRIWTEEINPEMMDYCPGGGFFIESGAKELNALSPLLKQKCQTLSYFGLDSDKLREILLELKPLGVDRVVPIGSTLDFSLTWDGYDIIRSLSREITII